MTSNEFLYNLKNGVQYLVTEDDPNAIDGFVDELITLGLVKKVGDFYRLDRKGILLTNSGKSYEDWIRNESQTTHTTSINIGHNLTNARVSGSSFNIDSTLEKDTDKQKVTYSKNKTNETKETLWGRFGNWIIVIIGFIASLIAIYEFIIKK